MPGGRRCESRYRHAERDLERTPGRTGFPETPGVRGGAPDFSMSSRTSIARGCTEGIAIPEWSSLLFASSLTASRPSPCTSGMDLNSRHRQAGKILQCLAEDVFRRISPGNKADPRTTAATSAAVALNYRMCDLYRNTLLNSPAPVAARGGPEIHANWISANVSLYSAALAVQMGAGNCDQVASACAVLLESVARARLGDLGLEISYSRSHDTQARHAFVVARLQAPREPGVAQFFAVDPWAVDQVCKPMAGPIQDHQFNSEQRLGWNEFSSHVDLDKLTRGETAVQVFEDLDRHATQITSSLRRSHLQDVLRIEQEAPRDCFAAYSNSLAFGRRSLAPERFATLAARNVEMRDPDDADGGSEMDCT